MPDIVFDLAAAVFLSIFTHEGGHYVAALIFGKRISFRFECGKLFGLIPIPRGVWDMPVMESWKQKVVAVAGFGTELICAGVAAALGWPYLLLVASIHLLAYPFYAGEANDFKWL